MKKLVAIATVLTVMLTGATVLLAQPEVADCGPWIGKDLPAKLDLTDEQKTKLADLRLQFAKETLPIRNELGVKRLELKQLMMAENPDQKAIEAKIDEVKRLEAQLAKKRAAHHLAVLKILTPEQRKKMRAFGPLGHGRMGCCKGVRQEKRIMLRMHGGPGEEVEKIIELRHHEE